MTGMPGNAGALHHLVGIEDEFLRMLSFFPGHVILAEHFLVVLLYLAHVADEDIKAFHFCQRCCSNAALGGSKYYYSVHLFIYHLTIYHLPFVPPKGG